MRIGYSAAAILAVASISLVACSSSSPGAEPDVTSITAAATSTVAAARPAPYMLQESGKGEYIALVQTADVVQLSAAWRKIRDQILKTEADGGYFVRFDCSVGDDPSKAANRLANAKVAVGAFGAAQTGLRAGGAEFKATSGPRCGDDPGYKSTANRTAPLSEQSVNDLCHEFIEEKYTVEQLPVTITETATSASADGGWLATGTAQGTSKYGTDIAVMQYRCEVSNTAGTMRRDVTLTS
ncbi:hypothetical protein [Rhodococcus globerulus]|uniref:hypothetical protein n=1 Tax=Rhodococcus globerulus TaxID=33008 RepID=UPI0030184073